MRHRLDLAASLIVPAEVYFLAERTAWTLPAGPRYIRSSACWPPAARPCCSPPSAWTRGMSWPPARSARHGWLPSRL